MNPTVILAFAPAHLLQGVSLYRVVPLAFVFFAFVAFQLLHYLRCRRALAKQLRTLVELRAEGGVPEHSPNRDGTREDWVAWVASRFKDGAFQDGHFTRDDAIEQLDDWLEGKESYVVLQRTSNLAPMVGVLLTVAAFLSLDLPEGDSTLTEIFRTVSRVLLGAGSGAALTFFSHFLLHVAGKRTAVVRTAACRWFDECIWRRVQVKPQLAANDVAEALQEMGATIRGSIEQYRGATAAIGQTSQFLRDAGTALVNTAERLGGDTVGIRDELTSLRDMAGGVVGLLRDIVPNIEHTTLECAEAAGALKSVMQVQLAQAAARHQESAESFARTVERIGESTEQFSAQLCSFNKMVSVQAAAGQEWSRSLQKDVLPAQHEFRQAGTQLAEAAGDLGATQRAFREAASSMQESANGLAGFVRDGVEPATRRLAELDQVLVRMRETTEAVREMTQLRQEFAVLARSLSQAAAAADAIRSLPQEIRTALQASVPSRNGSGNPRRPFYLRLLGLGRRSNGKP